MVAFQPGCSQDNHKVCCALLHNRIYDSDLDSHIMHTSYSI